MLSPNTVLQGRYLIVKQLGQGGMGAVYLATDQRFHKTVALKQAFFIHDSLTKAFEREARLLNDLRHPALPVVIDFFAESGGWFLVMDYVPGEDLAEALAKEGRGFAPDRVLRWADQMLDALEYLHGFDPPIIHRDIKPQNLKLTPRGDVMLLDFGLAKGSAAEMSQATGGKSVHGYTPHYAPIEQIRGTGTDVRSDIYAVAATLYHLVTGQQPPDALERAMAQLNGEPDPLKPVHDLVPAIGPEVSEVLHRALATHANQRPATAMAMRNMLRNASGLKFGDRGTGMRNTPGAAPPPVTQPALAVDTSGDDLDSAVETRLMGGATTPVAHAAPASKAPSEPPTEAAPVRRDLAPPEKPKSNMGLVAGIVVVCLVAAVALWVFLGPKRGGATGNKSRPEKDPGAAATRSFAFETVLVDDAGRVTSSRAGKAEYFTEALPGGVKLEMVLVPGGTFDMGSPKQSARGFSPDSVAIVPVAFVSTQRRPILGEAPPPREGPRNRPRLRDIPPDQQPGPERQPDEPQRPDVGEPSEHPMHQVTVGEFLIGKTEITQAQWRAVASLPQVARPLSPDPAEYKGDTLPVENVSWEDAVEFCERLSRATGRTYRLPSESEWEYACRAGTNTPFAFGQTLTPDLALYDWSNPFTGAVRKATPSDAPKPVASFGKANLFGLFDMHGNVGEWCADIWHDTYEGAPMGAGVWTSGGDSATRVVRGGSWQTSAAECRSASRRRLKPDDAHGVGFRVVLSAL